MMRDPVLPPLGLSATLEGADEDQLAFARSLREGPRRSVPSPFLGMMDAPALADAIQAVGLSLRFASSIDPQLREVAILATASAVNCAYEWNYHKPIALAEGAPWQAVLATRSAAALDGVEPRFQVVIRFCQAMADRSDDAATLRDAAVAQFGRRVTSELVAIAGYYPLLANFIKLAGHDSAPFRDSGPT